MLAHFSHHLIAALLQPLLPFIRDDFTLDYTQAGWVVSAFSLGYGISQIPGGWLADRFGRRLLITIGISGVALCGLLVGLSPTYVMMLVFLVLLGVMGGGYHPASSPVVSASVKEKNRGLALGIHQIGGTASFFLSPLIAVGIAIALGWRESFIVLAIPTFIFGIVFYVLLGRRGYTVDINQETPDSPAETLYTPVQLRHLVAFVTLGVVVQILIFSTISFIPIFLVDQFKISKELSVYSLILFHLAGFLGGPLGGYLSDRLGKVPVMLAISFLAGPVIYLLNLVSSGRDASLPLLLVGVGTILLIAGICHYMVMPISEAYIISHTPERKRSTRLGIYYSVSRGGASLAMVVGYLIDRFDFGTSFTIAGVAIFAVVLICSTFLWGSRD